ncbi:uncharacterized membrane protein YhaH (DUF805 family) [Sinobacterium caligoides]|uniref:Uncharacterized membrane protein YhaH (DUF805 family) n=1 Tax=Sinobacterium caligoides TaxID=933926 RepID=A0A3N2E0J3_9GAMM|nr:DUF805 domain-containing protein [Sinobacterium caligoides]ROS05432.1 uncharacterized membrane protein YhaH (DUF805 family) [Sinobacterium caligoides]
MEYFTAAFNKYADFTGRARRQEFWMFILFYYIFYLVACVIDWLMGTVLLSGIYMLVTFLPYISISARRLHDTGRTGWWQLIALIPLIGFIILTVFFIQESAEDNDYGPSPSPE